MPAAPPAPSKPRILIVDDEPSMREMLRIVLRRDGYDVMMAAERDATAIDRLKSERIDLLLSDIRMPDVSGVDVLRAAKDSQPRHRGVHDDGVRVDGHGRRGDAARRGRLLHQAVQHGRTAAEDPPASRDASAEAGERPAEAGAQRRRYEFSQHHRPQRRRCSTCSG